MLCNILKPSLKSIIHIVSPTLATYFFENAVCCVRVTRAVADQARLRHFSEVILSFKYPLRSSWYLRYITGEAD